MAEEILINENIPIDKPEPLPFPFNQRTFCRYEPIEKRIEEARVLVVDDLLRDEGDLSELAVREWGKTVKTQLKREREIAGMALDNIQNNIARLVRSPQICLTHFTDVAEAERDSKPDAIVLSGTLRDFDYYNLRHLEKFGEFIRSTKTPVLGICGGHQMVGMSFGAKVVTLDHMEQHERREGRPFEYQYRFIRITDLDDPIFNGIEDEETGVWQDYTTEASILRVWQNHGLQLDRVPEGFKLLATAYLCRNQMMVKRADGQLIYTVQFHLEKSFEDYDRRRATRWEHQNESRDGRILFENFLLEALKLSER
ncbi:MAG TPA: gamma-glutamyl-gamma-aminobutyrate hydrolase family protein [Pyrinomonadaceae bacterium]|nr:gamma-glutamyl-gamma-aminobutyrate hydrolase family protein [Pyrinomonadaceae bacterium]